MISQFLVEICFQLNEIETGIVAIFVIAVIAVIFKTAATVPLVPFEETPRAATSPNLQKNSHLSRLGLEQAFCYFLKLYSEQKDSSGHSIVQVLPIIKILELERFVLQILGLEGWTDFFHKLVTFVVGLGGLNFELHCFYFQGHLWVLF